MSIATAPGLTADYEAMLADALGGLGARALRPLRGHRLGLRRSCRSTSRTRAGSCRPTLDPLGATAWYQAQPLDRQIEIGTWRVMNAVKVGGAFESILIRGLMHYAMSLPNGSPEFRYCLHEMTEECNHIQMFQELVNRSGADVPGMRPLFKAASPLLGFAGGYLPVILMIGILAGEEPIDHYQKSILREGADLPPAVLRAMEIHIAEEARHISFADEFLRLRIPRLSRVRARRHLARLPGHDALARRGDHDPAARLQEALRHPATTCGARRSGTARSPARSWPPTSATCARWPRRPAS